MGCFDSLLVPCLFCGVEIQEQTKSGPCMLDYYKWDDPNLPIWMMQDMNGMEIQCYECGRKFRIVFDYEVVRKGQRLEPVDNLDYLELKVKEQEEKNND